MNLRAAAAVLLALALALGGCSSGSGDTSHGPRHDSSTRPADVNDVDVMFTMMMIPHHEQAVEMSDILLAKGGVDARVATLARQIKAAQQPEIELMEGWLQDWGQPAHGGRGGMGHGEGMMSADDLAALEAADGAAASPVFLQQMIAHHEGAIDMAQDAIDGGSSDDVGELARAIVTTQTAEIRQMNELLDTL